MTLTEERYINTPSWLLTDVEALEKSGAKICDTGFQGNSRLNHTIVDSIELFSWFKHSLC